MEVINFFGGALAEGEVAERFKIIKEMGEDNIAITLETPPEQRCLHRCSGDIPILDLSDEELSGAVKILSRPLNPLITCIFEHAVYEQERRAAMDFPEVIGGDDDKL